MGGRCESCRHWGRDHPPPSKTIFDEQRDGRTRTVAWRKEHPVCRPCKHPDLTCIDGHDRGYCGVEADGFGLDYPVCDLMTGPQFGCVKWEPEDS